MYIKVLFLSANIAVHKLDIICLSETYFNFETTSTGDKLKISGYNFFRKDHPNNSKCRGAYVCNKSSLPFLIFQCKISLRKYLI